MGVMFEQARAILADDLDVEGDGRRVAAWGWENDEVFVLAFDLRADDSEDDDGVVVDDPELDTWGAPEDIQAMREQVKLIPPGWDPWRTAPRMYPSRIRPPGSCAG
ncbi:hypothetical protein [Mycobacterium sp. 23]|uniref:hypothetical protein n=1 Tax=Mycobacterium sp. 23 TaxID=3400424 RepID=UPI003AABF087